MRIKLILLILLTTIPVISHAQWINVHSITDLPKMPEQNKLSFSTPEKGMGIEINASMTSGIISRTFNGGSTWDSCYITNKPGPYQIINLDSDIFIATLENYILLRTFDFGNTWDTIYLNAPAYLLDFPSASVGYYYGGADIYKTTDTGATWTLMNQNTITLALDMEFANDSTGIICSIDSLFVTHNYGQTWTSVYHSGYPPFFAVEFPSINNAYAFLFDWMSVDSLVIINSVDGGNTWNIKSKTPHIVNLGDIEFPSDSVGYIICELYILKTINGGLTWEKQKTTYGLNEFLYDVDFINDSVGFISGVFNQFHRTANGGAKYDTLKYVFMFPSSLVEGCTHSFLVFQLSKPQPDTVYFPVTILPSTATHLVDFSQIPDTVFLYPGDTLVTIPIETYSDNINECIESCTLYIPNSLNDTIVFYIIDSSYFSVNITASSLTSCGGNQIALKAEIQPFMPMAKYYWNPYGNCSPLAPFNNTKALPDTSAWYKVSAFASDFQTCISLEDSIFINYYPTYSTSLFDTICANDSIWFGNQYISLAGYYFDKLLSSNGCDSNLHLYLSVQPLPIVNLALFNPDTVCSTTTAVMLPQAQPVNGVYSGAGVNYPYFSPSAAGLGVHWIKYSYTNNQGCSDSDSSAINVINCTSINEYPKGSGALILRYSSNYELEIIADNCWSDIEEIGIYDALGKLVIEQNVKACRCLINTSLLSKGMYFIKAGTVDGQKFTEKFAIIK